MELTLENNVVVVSLSVDQDSGYSAAAYARRAEAAEAVTVSAKDQVVSDREAVSTDREAVILARADVEEKAGIAEQAAVDAVDAQKAAVLIEDELNPVYSPGRGPFYSESSTFSGWGASFPPVSDFNCIKLWTRYWDVSNPVTKVRCLIRENDRFGAVITDQTIDFNAEVLEEIEVVLHFPVYTNVENNRVWVEFFGNGRMGRRPALDYDSATGDTARYKTENNIESTFADSSRVSSSGVPIAIELGVMNTSVKGTSKFVEGLKSQLPFAEKEATETGLSKKLEKKIGTNLADPGAFRLRGMVRVAGNITFSSNENYAITDYIPIKEGETVTINKNPSHANSYFALFDENKQVISGTITKNRTLPFVEGAKYAVFSILAADQDVMVNLGTSSLNFEPYSVIGGYLPKKEDTVTPTLEKGVEVVLPSEIYITEGSNLQLFYKSCVKAVEPFIFDIVSICSVGKSFPRYFEFRPSSNHVGNTFNLTINVRRNDLSIIASGVTQLKIIQNPASPTQLKNILVFGASATAGGQMVGELRRRLTGTSGSGNSFNPDGLGLSNISFVGRKTGTSVSVPLEATGGWRWADYTSEGRQAYRFYVAGVVQVNIGDTYTLNGVTVTITEINVTEGAGEVQATYTGSNALPTSGVLVKTSGSGDASISYSGVDSETFNPFWHGGSLDFVNYANIYCNGKIDYLIAHCGVNDIFARTTGQQIVDNYVKPFARSFHLDFPDAFFIVSTLPLPSPNGGMGANYGATSHNYYNRSQEFWGFAKAVNQMVQDAEFSSYVRSAPVLQMFDNQNGYPTIDVPVNNRTLLTEKRGSNGVHPTTEGSYMVADSIFPVIASIL
jgi:hypothetical protein